MGTLWHHWSPVLISLAALFSKGEDAAAARAQGLTSTGVSVWECVEDGGGRERGLVCMCVCARVNVRSCGSQARSSDAPWPKVLVLEHLGGRP